jgi:hypothetical protein
MNTKDIPLYTKQALMGGSNMHLQFPLSTPYHILIKNMIKKSSLNQQHFFFTTLLDTHYTSACSKTKANPQKRELNT